MENDTLIKKMVNATPYPQPLSKKEETEIILRVKNGDESAKEILINHNLRLSVHIAKKYARLDDIDDLISIGDFGLIKAAETFQPDRGTKFSTYACRCIEYEILMHLRKIKNKTSKELSLEGSIDQKDANFNFLNRLHTIDENTVFENVEKSIQRDKLRKLLKKILKPIEYDVICYRYGFYDGIPRTQSEIAKFLQLSRSYVSRIESRAMEKIKQNIGDVHEEWLY